MALTNKLSAIGNAIRSKTGGSELLTLDQMPQAIESITTGYSNNDWLDNSKPSGKVESDKVFTSNTGGYLIAGRTGITELSLPNAIGLGTYFAKDCINLTVVNLPLVGNLNAFSLSNTGIEYLVLPSMFTNSNNALNGCRKLKGVDFGGTNSAAQYYNLLFNTCTIFNTMIIRDTTRVHLLNNINVFYNTPFANGKAGGTLYVPQALIEDYKVATNWSVIINYENNKILPIEGSIYETHYVDGTPIE